jgi:YhcH/YjgK/YiaL family protein
MILGSINNTVIAEKIHLLFKKAFDYIKATDFEKMIATSSNVELYGSNLFLSVKECHSKTKEEAKMEAHKKYIDIQIPIIGTEQVGWFYVDKCTKALSPFNTESDLILFNDSASFTLLSYQET